ncbi:tRNA threonylcarbamoyl adenosine modification protein YeaZ [Bradyrhizobium sp. LB7.2]
MLILAIDTALEACAAAVLDTDAGQLLAQEQLLMKRGHAEALMPMIARVMLSANLAFTSLDRIAVTMGPGSFTGLRVGISAARGLALAAKRPAVGLTTLSAYAATVVGQSGTAPVISAIDARHDHIYFQIVARRRQPAGTAGRRVRRRGDRGLAIRRAASGRQCRKNPRRALAERYPAAGRGRRAARA